MSNFNYAGPYPDGNVTLNQVNDVIARLKLLGMAAVMTVIAPVTGTGSFNVMSDYLTEQDLLDAGVDPANDPVYAALKVTNEGIVVTDTHAYPWEHLQSVAQVKRNLDRGGLENLRVLLWPVFGIQVDLSPIIAQIEANLPAGKTLVQVMQGK